MISTFACNPSTSVRSIGGTNETTSALFPVFTLQLNSVFSVPPAAGQSFHATLMPSAWTLAAVRVARAMASRGRQAVMGVSEGSGGLGGAGTAPRRRLKDKAGNAGRGQEFRAIWRG